MLRKNLIGWKKENVFDSVVFISTRGNGIDFSEIDTFCSIVIPYTEQLNRFKQSDNFYTDMHMFSDPQKRYSIVNIHGRAIMRMNGDNYTDSFGSEDLEKWFAENYS